MKSKVFIDTKIFIYAIDHRDEKKQRLSREKLLQAEKDGTGVISTQILQEFFVAAVKKLGIDPVLARQQTEKIANFEVVDINVELVREAMDCSIFNQLSFWDALIVVAAQSARCEAIWSEDFSHRQTFKTVKIENIFKIRPWPKLN